MTAPSTRDTYVEERVEKIREIINEIHSYLHESDNGSVMTDGVVVYARKSWTADGWARNSVTGLPLDPFQPDYVTTGLLSYCLDMVGVPEFSGDDEEDLPD